MDGRAGKLDNVILRLNACLGRGRIGPHLGHERPLRVWQVKLSGQVLVDGLHADAQVSPMHLPILEKLRADPLGDVDGNCEANALKPAAR